MHIEKLEIKGFGKLSGLNLELDKGFNLIYGLNESGKTTLQCFIKAMLYGLKGGRAGKEGPSPLNRFKPWQGAAFGGALEYRLDNGRVYRVERDFDRGTVEVYDSLYNNVTATYANGRDRTSNFAEAHLGLNELCFEKTAFVRQMETKLDDDGGSELLSKLANAGMTGYEDVSFKKAETALRDALKRYVGTDRTTVQPLDRVEARLRELKASRDVTAKRRNSLLGASDSLNEAIALKDDLRQKKGYLQKIKELFEIRNRLDESIKRESSLRSASKRLREVDESLSAAAQELDGYRQKGGSAQAGKAGDRQTKASFYIPSGLLLALSVLSAIFLPSGSYLNIFVSAAIFIAGILAAILTFFIQKAGTAPEADARDAGREAGAGVDPGFEACMQKIAGLREKAKDILGEASLSCGRQLPGLQELERALSETASSIEVLDGRLDEFLKSAAAAKIDAEGDLYDTDRLQAVICDSDPSWLQVSIEYELDRVNQAVSDNLLNIKEYETLLREDGEDGEELQRMEEETAVLHERKETLARTGASLKMALDMLNEAGMEMRRNFAPALNAKMSRAAEMLTGGRYTDLRADDVLDLKTPVPESGEVKTASLLSGGTADQMYLALRLSLAELLAPAGESLPLLLDEVFSQYDDERMKLSLEYLNNACMDRQVILFTCKKREKEIAHEVCREGMNLVELT